MPCTPASGTSRAAAIAAAARRPRPGRHGPIARRVQHREHASLDLPAARHADNERRRPVVPERVSQLQQVLGVVARPRAGVEHLIVAGQLAFHAKAARNPPHAGVGPVDGARHGGHQLREAVVADDVRQLMEKDGAAPVPGPRVGQGGNQNGGCACAESHRHAALEAAQQADARPDAHLPGALGEQPRPFRVLDVHRASSEPMHQPSLVNEPEQEQEHDGEVDAGQDRGARRSWLDDRVRRLPRRRQPCRSSRPRSLRCPAPGRRWPRLARGRQASRPASPADRPTGPAEPGGRPRRASTPDA